MIRSDRLRESVHRSSRDDPEVIRMVRVETRLETWIGAPRAWLGRGRAPDMLRAAGRR